MPLLDAGLAFLLARAFAALGSVAVASVYLNGGSGWAVRGAFIFIPCAEIYTRSI